MSSTTENRSLIDEDVSPELLERLATFVGQGADRPGLNARCPVSQAIVNQMTDAVGDRNPLYRDEEFALSTVHGGVVAPPLWLFAWLMPGLEPEEDQAYLEDGTPFFHLAPSGQRSTARARRTIRDELNEVLQERGFDSPAVTDMTYVYERYLRIGERPSFSSWVIDAISPPKRTALGLGFFVTMHMTVTVGGELIATIRQRYLRFRSGAGPAKSASPAHGSVAAQRPDPRAPLPPLRHGPVSARTRETLFFEDVKAGDALAPLAVRISPTLVISGALASLDWQDVHHDYSVMKERGHPDIFMNMMTSSGLVGRFVTDWTGPNAIVRGHVLRLRRPNYPGDTMRLSGTVRTVDVVDGRGLMVLDVVGSNSLGTHCEAEVTMELPRRS